MSKWAVEIRDAEHGDIARLLHNIRLADLAEIRATTLASPAATLRASLAHSTYCRTGLIGGELACIMGVGPVTLLSSVGSPWMIGTKLLDDHPLILARHSKSTVRQMLLQFPVLRNYVDERNERAIAWLRWIGFTLSDPLPYGPYGLPFLPFELRLQECA